MAQICSIQVKSSAISRISVSPSYTLSQAQTHLCTLQGMLQSPDTEYSPAALIKDSRAGPNTAAPTWLSKGCLRASQEGKDHKGLVLSHVSIPTAQPRQGPGLMGWAPAQPSQEEEIHGSWSQTLSKALPCGNRSGPDLPPQARKGKEGGIGWTLQYLLQIVIYKYLYMTARITLYFSSLKYGGRTLGYNLQFSCNRAEFHPTPAHYLNIAYDLS